MIRGPGSSSSGAGGCPPLTPVSTDAWLSALDRGERSIGVGARVAFDAAADAVQIDVERREPEVGCEDFAAPPRIKKPARFRACRRPRADRKNRVTAAKGGASEPFDTLPPDKAGGAVAVRRTLATTICRIADPTQVSRPRQLRDASTVRRFRPAHQRMVNRRHDGRASCLAPQSLKRPLPMEPQIHAPATWKGGRESGTKLTLGTVVKGPEPLTVASLRAPLRTAA
jgi:hypothetical protein